MAIRFKKSKKIAPGLKLNLSLKSIGISAGGKRARVSASSSGRKTASLSLFKGLSIFKSKG